MLLAAAAVEVAVGGLEASVAQTFSLPPCHSPPHQPPQLLLLPETGTAAAVAWLKVVAAAVAVVGVEGG